MLHYVHISLHFSYWVTEVLKFYVSLNYSYTCMYLCIVASIAITPISHDHNSLQHSNTECSHIKIPTQHVWFLEAIQVHQVATCK